MIKYREYRTAEALTEYLLTVSGVDSVRIGELCEVTCGNNGSEIQNATVVAIDGRSATLRLYKGAQSLNSGNIRVRFTGRAPTVTVSENLLGRRLDGFGEVADNGPRLICGKRAEIYSPPMSPAEKTCPTEMLMTGLSAVDVFSPILKGQKLALLSGYGIPYEDLLLRLTAQYGKNASNPIIIYAGVGMTARASEALDCAVSDMGIIDRTVRIVSTADAPLPERLATPHTAMTVAEYFATECGACVIVLLSDVAAYAEAHRASAIDAGEAMASNGYPVTLYPDLAAIVERAGVYKRGRGSVTLIAATVSDASTPITEALRRTTDGRITLSTVLYKNGVYPPIDPRHSFSALRKNAKNTPVSEHRTEALLARYAEAISGKGTQISFAQSLLDALVSQDMRTFRSSACISDTVEKLLTSQ